MSDSAPVPVVGLVGGVGSGKSSVARQVAARLADTVPLLIIDGDKTGHEVLGEPAVRDKLQAAFGDTIFHPDSSVNRPVLASLVFGDEPEKQENLKTLESIVHPRIRDRVEELVAQAAISYRAVLLDAAVLLEAGWRDACTAVVFVDTPLERRQEFIKSRGWSSAELARRESSQFPLEQKKQLADFAISNTGTLESAGEQLEKIIQQILETGVDSSV